VCQGEVPQSEDAPWTALKMNEESSGQRGRSQKYESRGTEMARARSALGMPAVITVCRETARRWRRKKTWVTSRRAISARKMTPARTRRCIPVRCLDTVLSAAADGAGIGRNWANARVVSPNANMFGSVRDA